MALSKYKEGAKDLRAVCRVAPNDKDARKKLEECEKIIKRISFEEAINSDQDKKLPSDSIDLNSFSVDSSYQGPRLPEDGTVTLEFVKDMIETFKNQKLVHKKYIYTILLKAKEIMKPLPSLVDIPFKNGSKFTVCGDTHGQFYDLLNIFELNGFPSEENPYLFNGDYVDRGSFSIEVVMTLLALKVLYPNHFFMTRGNHESDDMNKIYGFQGEAKAKYGETSYELFKEIFCYIPLAACIGQKVLVVHGGDRKSVV